eukprot:CAMPEP_0115034442 /NCGR_PEP_ID=MMETSP0216-20121206/40652_1 /TAXON_ID=223996 /ORGANISM="Protocruzia adherens, Strain Boccale" /LENGTH=387 /DNA_ID=CAMNT_0002413325 /DNA_START=38 /DNA_END=1201 /DNA_ORIENTATION=+
MASIFVPTNFCNAKTGPVREIRDSCSDSTGLSEGEGLNCEDAVSAILDSSRPMKPRENFPLSCIPQFALGIPNLDLDDILLTESCSPSNADTPKQIVNSPQGEVNSRKLSRPVKRMKSRETIFRITRMTEEQRKMDLLDIQKRNIASEPRELNIAAVPVLNKTLDFSQNLEVDVSENNILTSSLLKQLLNLKLVQERPVIEKVPKRAYIKKSITKQLPITVVNTNMTPKTKRRKLRKTPEEIEREEMMMREATDQFWVFDEKFWRYYKKRSPRISRDAQITELPALINWDKVDDKVELELPAELKWCPYRLSGQQVDQYLDWLKAKLGSIGRYYQEDVALAWLNFSDYNIESIRNCYDVGRQYMEFRSSFLKKHSQRREQKPKKFDL